MQLKKLSAEGRFESGLDAVLKGKEAYAFTAVVNDQHEKGQPPYRLGVAVANEPGYYPVPLHWSHSDNYEAMLEHAHELNDALGLSRREAALIISSSMAAQNWRDRRDFWAKR